MNFILHVRPQYASLAMETRSVNVVDFVECVWSERCGNGGLTMRTTYSCLR